jgi:hypothetical protein
MPLLSARLLVPVAVVVAAWGGFQILSSHNLAVSPAVWPAAATTPSSVPADAVVNPAASSPAPAPAPSPSIGGAVPILPGALQQLNGSTRDTAVGLYALIQQLEQALRTHLEQLAQQLEPGR